MNAGTRDASAEAAFEACQKAVEKGLPAECVYTADGTVSARVGGLYYVPIGGGGYNFQPADQDIWFDEVIRLNGEVQRLDRNQATIIQNQQ